MTAGGRSQQVTPSALTNLRERVSINQMMELTLNRDGHTAPIAVDIIDVNQPPRR
jgi:hypothetical protein